MFLARCVHLQNLRFCIERWGYLLADFMGPDVWGLGICGYEVEEFVSQLDTQEFRVEAIEGRS